jgi:hypothetical protein
MQISFEGKLGLVLGLIALAGAGAIMVAPDKLWIGWSLIAIAALGGVMLGFHHFGRKFFVVIVAACILWFDYWYDTRPDKPTLPQPTQVPPTTTMVPSKSQDAWVSDEEMQKAKKAGRLLLPFRPYELSRMNYSMGSAGTDAYVGQWVKIDDPLLSVSRLTEKDKKEYLTVRILQPVWSAVLIFDAKKWGDKVLVMNPNAGARVRALCQLAKYEGSNDFNSPKFIGENCELN